MPGKSIIDIIRENKDRSARRNAVNLPTPEEFRKMSNTFYAAELSGGGMVDTEGCRNLAELFNILSIAIIAVETE